MAVREERAAVEAKAKGLMAKAKVAKAADQCRRAKPGSVLAQPKRLLSV